MKIEVLYKTKNNFIESKIIDVPNLDIDTIRKLPFYKSDYYAFKLIDGKEVIKTVYNGRRISFKDTLKLVQNDAKYKALIYHIGLLRQKAFLEQDILDEEDFINTFDKKHYTLFTIPDNFDSYILSFDKKGITIEEYDPNIKTSFDSYLKLVSLNAKLGESYTQDNTLLLNIFTVFFQMFSKALWEIVENENGLDSALAILDENADNIRRLYNIIKFNFEEFGKYTWEDIEEFLDFFYYAYDMGSLDKKIFNIYKELVKEEKNNNLKK